MSKCEKESKGGWQNLRGGLGFGEDVVEFLGVDPQSARAWLGVPGSGAPLSPAPEPSPGPATVCHTTEDVFCIYWPAEGSDGL